MTMASGGIQAIRVHGQRMKASFNACPLKNMEYIFRLPCTDYVENFPPIPFIGQQFMSRFLLLAHKQCPFNRWRSIYWMDFIDLCAIYTHTHTQRSLVQIKWWCLVLSVFSMGNLTVLHWFSFSFFERLFQLLMIIHEAMKLSVRHFADYNAETVNARFIDNWPVH